VVKRNKIQMMAWITPAQAKALKRLSAKTGIPQSVIVRDGLDFAIKKYRKKHRI
jgi:Ribbon-helix-helix domain